MERARGSGNIKLLRKHKQRALELVPPSLRRCLNGPSPSPSTQGRANAGYFGQVARSAGGVDPQVKEVECRARAQTSCVWEISWQQQPPPQTFA